MKSSAGGESFRRFLEQELVPYVDKEFSTSAYRIYCGYSFTGLSVIDELLDESFSVRCVVSSLAEILGRTEPAGLEWKL